MIIGHQKQWQFLKKSAELGKLSHAYLFSGQEKLGKKTIAIEFVKWLFKEPPTKILVGGHPDFVLVKPMGREIQISQIRELCWKISLKPSISQIKAAIIDQAHLMNEEAQNCFLKTLEEPKGKTLLILITNQPEFLFPTILSRCQLIKFYPVKRIEIENYLKNQGISESEVKEITDISSGMPGVAIDFISNPQKLESYQKAIKELTEIPNLSLAGRFQCAKELSQSGNLREILEIWLSYFRGVLIKKCLNPVRNYNNGAKASREQISKGVNFEIKQSGYSLSKLKNVLNQIQNTNFLLSTTNVNPRLALEILMLNF